MFKSIISKFFKEKISEKDRLFQEGVMYFKGKIYPKSYFRARKRFEKSAELGHPIAQRMLSILLLEGKGCQINHEKSLFWAKKSADNGLENAKLKVVEMYLNGIGTQKCVDTAKKYFTQISREKLTKEEVEHYNEFSRKFSV